MPALLAVASQSSLRPSASILGRVSHGAAANLGHVAAGPGSDAASAPPGRRLRSEGWRQPGPLRRAAARAQCAQTGPPRLLDPSGSGQPDPMDDQAIVAGQMVPAPGGPAECAAGVPSGEAPTETRRPPIFDAVESHWSSNGREAPGSPGATATTRSDWPSPADEGWRAAETAESPPADALTSAGLPRRPPDANLIPGAIPGPPSAAPNRSAAPAGGYASPGCPAGKPIWLYSQIQATLSSTSGKGDRHAANPAACEGRRARPWRPWDGNRLCLGRELGSGCEPGRAGARGGGGRHHHPATPRSTRATRTTRSRSSSGQPLSDDAPIFPGDPPFKWQLWNCVDAHPSVPKLHRRDRATRLSRSSRLAPTPARTSPRRATSTRARHA